MQRLLNKRTRAWNKFGTFWSTFQPFQTQLRPVLLLKIHTADQSDWITIKQSAQLIDSHHYLDVESWIRGQIKGGSSRRCDWTRNIKTPSRPERHLTTRERCVQVLWTHTAIKADRWGLHSQQQQQQSVHLLEHHWSTTGPSLEHRWREAAAECRTSASSGSWPRSWEPAATRSPCTVCGPSRSRCCHWRCSPTEPPGGAAATRRCSAPAQRGSTTTTLSSREFIRTRTRTWTRTRGWCAGRNLQVRSLPQLTQRDFSTAFSRPALQHLGAVNSQWTPGYWLHYSQSF